MKRIEGLWFLGFLRILFCIIIQNSSNLRELINYIEGGIWRVLKWLNKLFTYNLGCYTYNFGSTIPSEIRPLPRESSATQKELLWIIRLWHDPFPIWSPPGATPWIQFKDILKPMEFSLTIVPIVTQNRGSISPKHPTTLHISQ